MIKQTFHYQDETILCIYHNGFPDYDSDRKIEKTEQLIEDEIKFVEQKIDNVGETIVYDKFTQGFLYAQDPKNPYSDLCCRFKEYINYNKSNIKEGRVENLQEFKQVAEFIKKWSGYDLLNSPMSLHNTIIFEPTHIRPEFSYGDEDERKLKITIPQKKYQTLTCTLKFKKMSYVTELLVSRELVEGVNYFSSKFAWNSVGIEIYSVDELVYAYENLSFIKHINIQMNLVTNEVNTELQHTQKKISLQQISTTPIDIGETAVSNELSTYNNMESLLKKRLGTKKVFEFLTTNEYEKGIELLYSISKSTDYEEMWLFDPYFIVGGEGGFKRTNDILKVFSGNLGMDKYVVFEEGKGEPDQFKRAIAPTVKEMKKRRVDLKFKFYSTSMHFHDRFIFLNNKHKMRSFLFGTSFNSFGDNYSTVVELDPLDGQIIFDSLKEAINGEDNKLTEYDFL